MDLGYVQVSIGFQKTAWLVAFICMISLLVPLALIALIARVPIKRQLERSMLLAIASSRETKLRLTSFERTVAQLTDERVRLQKEAAVARATQMLAHDVRKPFSMLKMTLDMLVRAKTPESVQKILLTAQNEIGRATASVDGLVQDVMDIGSGGELTLESVQVDTLIHSALVDTFRIYHTSDVDVEIKLHHTHDLNIDSRKVMRVLLNIMGNGLQAMSHKGRLWIRTADAKTLAEKDSIVFVIGNDGPQIPQEDRENLFEAFFTKNKKGGTGLGLAIAKKVVSTHGGKIWCESNAGVGVEFYFTLPAGTEQAKFTHEFPTHSSGFVAYLATTPRADELSDNTALEQLTTTSLQQLSRHLRVLVVDDEALYRNALCTHLNENKEHASRLQVFTAPNPEEAEAILENNTVDLAIIDVDLGAGTRSGLDLLASEREAGWGAFVCVHTNRILLDDNKRAMDLGADAFLPKPMARQHILKLVVQASAKATQNVVADAQVQSDANSSALTVAVVDDDAIVQFSWEMQLNGAKVVSFDSPEKFFERAAQDSGFVGSLSCVVTDLNFENATGMNGLDFAGEIKRKFPGTVVLLSSNATVDERDYSDAVDSVIPKGPVESASELRKIILRNKR